MRTWVKVALVVLLIGSIVGLATLFIVSPSTLEAVGAIFIAASIVLIILAAIGELYGLFSSNIKTGNKE